MTRETVSTCATYVSLFIFGLILSGLITLVAPGLGVWYSVGYSTITMLCFVLTFVVVDFIADAVAKRYVPIEIEITPEEDKCICEQCENYDKCPYEESIED